MHSPRRNVKRSHHEVHPTVKGNLFRLGKGAGTLLACLIQVLFFLQAVPYGGLYIGLLSLVLDLSIYCWVVSGAHKGFKVSPGRRKSLQGKPGIQGYCSIRTSKRNPSDQTTS
jgi:hypothetical protein